MKAATGRGRREICDYVNSKCNNTSEGRCWECDKTKDEGRKMMWGRYNCGERRDELLQVITGGDAANPFRSWSESDSTSALVARECGAIVLLSGAMRDGPSCRDCHESGRACRVLKWQWNLMSDSRIDFKLTMSTCEDSAVWPRYDSMWIT